MATLTLTWKTAGVPSSVYSAIRNWQTIKHCDNGWDQARTQICQESGRSRLIYEIYMAVLVNGLHRHERQGALA